MRNNSIVFLSIVNRETFCPFVRNGMNKLAEMLLIILEDTCEKKNRMKIGFSLSKKKLPSEASLPLVPQQC